MILKVHETDCRGDLRRAPGGRAAGRKGVKAIREKIGKGIRIILILFWLSFLTKTDAIYTAYLLAGILAVYSIALERSAADKRTNRFASLFGVIFTLCTCLGNYALFSSILAPPDYPLVRKAYFALCLVLMLTAGFTAGRAVFLLIPANGPGQRPPFTGDRDRSGSDGERPDSNNTGKNHTETMTEKSNSRFMFTAFTLFWGIDLLYLFLCGYPGNLTTDSLSQISQILTGVYHNQHPYWHTQVIRLFFMPVYRMTGDVNAAAASYSAAQSCILSLVFAYMAAVIRDLAGTGRYARRITAAAILYFAFSPVHILYSITVWKDVLFGAMTALFVTAMAARLYGLKRSGIGNTVLIAIGAAGMCLFRSNGWMAAAAAFLFMIPVYIRSGKDRDVFHTSFRPVLVSLAAVLAATFVMNHALIDRLGVEKGGILEACGVPLQQTARILYDKKAVGSGDMALIERAAPAEEIRKAFDPGIVDPVKGVLRINGGEHTVAQNKQAYLSLYFRLASRYPSSAVRAWTDLTRGYWDAGLDHYLWAQGVGGNDLGLFATERFAPARMIKNSYLWLFEQDNFLKLIKCMGLQIQILLALFLKELAGNRRSAVLYLPVLLIWATVLLAVPVNGEYRYLYSAAAAMPVLMAASFSGNEETA